MNLSGPWSLPTLGTHQGRFVTVEPLDLERHAAALYESIGRHDILWTYMPRGPFSSDAEFSQYFRGRQGDTGQDWRTYVFSPVGGGASGMASYMRMRPEHGSVEIGAVVFSPDMQRTAAASEAIMIMTRHMMSDHHYRRFEWKCHAENEASGRAAHRFGFQYEGRFRQDMVLRGKNRDTDWYSIIDREWRVIDDAWSRWLSDASASGLQTHPLKTYLADAGHGNDGEAG